MFSIVNALTAFVLVLPVELPDKTLVATLVLSTRFRPWAVFTGVTAAFGVQTLIAVTAGRLLTLLPDQTVEVTVALLFAIGAVFLLLASSNGTDVDDSTAVDEHFWRGVLTSFGVLFVAEWGDASQFATAALTARYDDPVSVFLGAFVALAIVAALAILLGRWILRAVPLRLVQRCAALLFLGFAVFAATSAMS